MAIEDSIILTEESDNTNSPKGVLRFAASVTARILRVPTIARADIADWLAEKPAT